MDHYSGIYLSTGFCVQLFLWHIFFGSKDMKYPSAANLISSLQPRLSIDAQPLVVVESIRRFQRSVGALYYILYLDNNPICLSNNTIDSNFKLAVRVQANANNRHTTISSRGVSSRTEPENWYFFPKNFTRLFIKSIACFMIIRITQMSSRQR
jgi:hypothetical protein